MTTVHGALRSKLWLSTRELLVVCVAVLLVIAGGVAFRLATGSTSATTAAWTVGGDFAAFYMAGRILNDHGGDRLYDFDLQERIYREIVPDAAELTLPFPYPPFIAVMFQPLALLPLPVALLIFLILTPLIFLGALALLIKRFGPQDREERALVLLGGLSFFPFAGYTWLGAQITVIAFVSVALAVSEEDRERYFLSGLALSLCLYKPTLLLLIVPMLLVSGRLQQLAGLVAGAAVLVGVSVIAAGSDSLVGFADRVRSMSTIYAGTSPSFLNPYRFVDANSFFRFLPHGRSVGGFIALMVIVVTASVALVRAWWSMRRADRVERLLVWAATLTWTLVLNIYTSAYDTILVVASAILAVAAVRARGWDGWNRLAPMLLCVYVAPWVAELSTRVIRVQVYTLALAAFGALLLSETRRTRSKQGSGRQSEHR